MVNSLGADAIAAKISPLRLLAPDVSPARLSMGLKATVDNNTFGIVPMTARAKIDHPYALQVPQGLLAPETGYSKYGLLSAVALG